MGDYRERIAAVQHEIWSHWMRYLFSVCGELNDDGSATIPAYNVERWHRQMATGYADLTDKERESDRNQADKVLAECVAEIAALRQQVAELEATLAAVRGKAQKFDDIAADWQKLADEKPEDSPKSGGFARISSVYAVCAAELREAIGID